MNCNGWFAEISIAVGFSQRIKKIFKEILKSLNPKYHGKDN
jgi:hypothetical protein